MKELSIEEKAKRYDEAVINGSRLWECGEITRENYEYIFPELKEEAEDEEIRKELIKFVKSRGGFKQEYIAWLEKQGEQPKEFTYTYEAETGNGDTKALVTEKVQRPKFKVGDVLCDKSCTTLNKDAQPNFEIVDIKDGMYICDKGSFPISQQDEYELVAKKIEQKPDWSEQDEINWIKSLKDKHTWKPSDEQMDALDDVISKGKLSYINQVRKLISLYNNLKQL